MLPWAACGEPFLDPGDNVLKLPLPLGFTINGRVIISSLLVAVLLVPAVDLARLAAHAQGQQSALPRTAGKQAEFVPGELLVRFRPGGDEPAVHQEQIQ